MLKIWFVFLGIVFCSLGLNAGEASDFYVKGTFYQDWLGFKAENSNFYNRISSRLKLILWNKPGQGWTASIDIRDRYTFSRSGENQFLIYETKLTYDKPDKKIFFSLGQMNLYDRAGIGVLTGGLFGVRLNKFLSVGGYAGIEPDIYNTKWDFKYNKVGFFARYLGSRAKQFSLSYNWIFFDGETERQFLYIDTLLPIKDIFFLYGNLEYELAPSIKGEDRLSMLFLNLRVNLTKYADITGHYSSGRGLDYHQYLLEQSQDPSIGNSNIERFYYSKSYGVRLSIKPNPKLRIYVSRRESEQKDREVVNHTTRLGASAINIFKTGISIYGNFSFNRGDASESDSYYISANRSFGKLSWGLSLANYYNGIRFSDDAAPEIIHLADHQTISSNFFFILNKALALSMEYAFTFQEEANEHQFFVRLIYRR